MSSKFETTIPFHNHKRRAKTPSFSSILLDAIYRSIDDDHHDDHHDIHRDNHHYDGRGYYYPRTTPASPTHSNVKHRDCEIDASDNLVQRRTKMRSDCTLETVDLRRAIMIDSWMENKQQPQSQPRKKHFHHLGDVLDQKVRIIRQKSVPSRARAPDDNLSSSSSSCFTNLAQRSSRDQSSSRIFTKTKSRALKIYSELKKSKSQNTPISPGRRIAAFLNSIFRNGSNSPTKTSPENPPPHPTTSNSTCSTASSFSRSCLSNKTSSSGKSTPATTVTAKRSVRFYPVSVILDEESKPCGHKSLHKNENEGSKKLVSPPPVNGGGDHKWRRDKEIDAMMMMIKKNRRDNDHRHDSRYNEGFEGEEMEEDEDDDGSCASSDLFELENLSSFGGVSRYYEELPLYGTTSLKNITA